MSESTILPTQQFFLQRHTDHPMIQFTYKNWRNETSERHVQPLCLWWGRTEYHPTPQWFLQAKDLIKGAQRDFALLDMYDMRYTIPVLERIIGVAVKNSVMVYYLPSPNRHHNILHSFQEHKEAIDWSGLTQGFWTDKLRFVDCKEALALAQANGQIIRQSSGPNPTELFSEDLW